jgi:Ca-activated chloride channel family protein
VLIAILAVAIAIAGAACTRDAPPRDAVHLANPGSCAPVDVVAAPEIAPVIQSAADAFNGSPKARFASDKCAFVRLQAIDSATTAAQITDHWRDTEHYGAPPTVWIPAAAAWVALVNARRAAGHERALATEATSIARSPTVVAMTAATARSLGWPEHQISWRDIAGLSVGKANPNLETTSLLATLAVDELHDPSLTRSIESSVAYYGDTSWSFLDNLARLDKLRSKKPFVSAVITDQRSVTAYNAGSANGTIPASVKASSKPHVPLVAIEPTEHLASDYPLTQLHTTWVSADAAAGARAFLSFVEKQPLRSELKKAGLQPGEGTVRFDATPVSDTADALAHWEQNRKRARVLLLFDVSDSMGDVSDPHDTNSPTKLALAQHAARLALTQLGPDDEVGLRIFTTDLKTPSTKWADLVPIGPLRRQRPALLRAINGLQPQQGSPLYAATRGAYDSMRGRYDKTRINGVVILTDGYNEVDADNNRKALLTHLQDPVRVFTISYSSEADLSTLRRIAQATDARVYDATDPSTIDTNTRLALSNF